MADNRQGYHRDSSDWEISNLAKKDFKIGYGSEGCCHRYSHRLWRGRLDVVGLFHLVLFLAEVISLEDERHLLASHAAQPLRNGKDRLRHISNGDSHEHHHLDRQLSVYGNAARGWCRCVRHHLLSLPVIFSVNNAVVQSAQPIISYNYGAKLDLRVSQTLRLSLLTAATCGIIVMLTMIAGSEKIVGMFLRPEENAYGIATCGLPWFASCSVFFALNVAFIGYYQSVTNASRAIVYTVLRGIIFPLATFMLLPSFFGATGLWLAIPAAEMVTLLIIVSMQFRNKL